MLNHSDILEKLTKLQKVAIVASAFDAAPFEQVDLPPVRRIDLNELGKKSAVSYASAIRSWDPEALGKLTEQLVSETGCKNNLFATPDLKTAVNPSQEGLSEDAWLNGAVGAAIVDGTHKAGGAIGLTRPSLSEKEIAFMDTREDASAVRELFVKPFLLAVKNQSCDAVFVDPSRQGIGYYDTNRSIFNDVQSGILGNDLMVVGEGETFTADAVNLLHGKVTLGGCTIPLERAVRRYSQLKNYVAEGSIPLRELEDSLLHGTAIDDETLDELVDRIIDFALALDSRENVRTNAESTLSANEEIAETNESEQPSQTESETDTQPLQTESQVASQPSLEFSDELFNAKKIIAEESVVLLKNSGILPLNAGARIAVLGEAYKDLTAMNDKFAVVGKAQGYERATARSDSLIPAAVRSTQNADAAVVFLYPDESGKTALPANRLALLDALKQANKRVVAIVCGDRPVDMSFDGDVDALLVAPADGPFASEALAKILCGEVNPSGKLARSYYDDADEYYSEIRANRDSGKMRIGPFAGYRRYDIEKTKARYPFGFGLSYTKFAYSDLVIGEKDVTFTVSNCGNRDGCEIAQVYIGVPCATHVAPQKQLKAFCRVYLQKGESKKITLALAYDQFATFDPRLFTDNVETGEYTVYVGSSAADIRLQGKKYLQGVTRREVKYNLADYTPNGDYGEVSLVSREARVAKKKDDVPTNLRKLRKAAIYGMALLAVAFFILLSVFILSYALDYILLTVMEADAVKNTMFAAAIGMMVLVPLVGSLNRKRLVRIRNVALVFTPILVALCLVLYSVMLYGGGYIEEIALRITTCVAVGAPIVAVVATCLERQLWRKKMGKNHWDKYYFEREHEGKTTTDAEFRNALHAAEVARGAKVAEQSDEEPTVIVEVPQFYDKRLTYTQLLGDCKQFVTERGLNVPEETLRDWIAALSSTQLIFVPHGDGAALCEAISEYFGRKAYVDNAEEYTRFDDLFSQWSYTGFVNTPSNLWTAIETSARETAYLHTVLIRHVRPNMTETLFRPIADVLARQMTTLPFGDGVALPANILIVAEIESDSVVLPEYLAEVAAVIVPHCEECEVAQRKTIVQTVGFERITAMRQTVRDDHPLDEDRWKNVDLLDEHCKSAHIGNHLWIKVEIHASVAAACGSEQDEAIDSAIAVELLPWLSQIWNDEVCEGSLSAVLTEIFGEKLTQSMALLEGAFGDKK